MIANWRETSCGVPKGAETLAPKLRSLFLEMTWSRRVTNEMIYYRVDVIRQVSRRLNVFSILPDRRCQVSLWEGWGLSLPAKSSYAQLFQLVVIYGIVLLNYQAFIRKCILKWSSKEKSSLFQFCHTCIHSVFSHHVYGLHISIRSNQGCRRVRPLFFSAVPLTSLIPNSDELQLRPFRLFQFPDFRL